MLYDQKNYVQYFINLACISCLDLCSLHKSAHDAHDHGRGTSNGAQSGRNTRDRKNKHHITPKQIITTTYIKSTTDKVHSAVDSLIMCCLKMSLCGLKKHVAHKLRMYIYFNDIFKHFNEHFSELNVDECHINLYWYCCIIDGRRLSDTLDITCWAWFPHRDNWEERYLLGCKAV
jgi:hypothetical protein